MCIDYRDYTARSLNVLNNFTIYKYYFFDIKTCIFKIQAHQEHGNWPT